MNTLKRIIKEETKKILEIKEMALDINIPPVKSMELRRLQFSIDKKIDFYKKLDSAIRKG